MTTLFETSKPETEGTPYQDMPRACTRCGQAINAQRDSWKSTATGIRHTTCPTSPEIAGIPTITEGPEGSINILLPDEPADEHEFMTQQEAADLLRVHLNTVYALIKSGQLPALRVIGRRRILLDRRDVLALLERVIVEPVPHSSVRVGEDLAAPLAAGFTNLERDSEETRP